MTRIFSKEALSYAFYDFANSSYALLILTFTYAVYFKTVVVGSAQGDFLWGVVTAIPVLLAVFLSPVIGAIADACNTKKRFLVITTLVTIAFTALLATVHAGEILKGSLYVILASTFYYLATLFYDAFIVDVAEKNSVGKISGFSWGLGYVGGLAALVIAAPLIKGGVSEGNLFRYQMSFVVTALFYLLFSLPIFLFVRQRVFTKNAKRLKENIAHALHDLRSVWLKRKAHRNFFLLVIAFFFYNDALSTMFAFISIFASSTIMMSIKEITSLLIVSQIVAFPAAWGFGALADRIGQKKVIFVTLSIVLLFSMMAALATSKALFFSAIVLASLGIGASQSCTRAFIRKIVPEEHATEFFGFQSFIGKFSAFLGPLLFGFLSVSFSNQRVGFVSVALFLVLGMIILSKVKNE